MFIDSHCHLDFPEFAADRSLLLKQAQAVGVKAIIIPAVEQSRWGATQECAIQQQSVFFGLGVHPWYVHPHQDPEELHQALMNWSAQERWVAIGEIGLDAYKPNYSQQQAAFLAQLRAAGALDKPVMIHCVKAQQDVLEALKTVQEDFPNLRGVIHGYGGSLEIAEQFIALGFTVGVGGLITRSKKLQRAVSNLPLSALLLETDAPAMPLKGEDGAIEADNTPLNIPRIFDHLVALRSEAPEVLAKTIFDNTRSLFDLPAL